MSLVSKQRPARSGSAAVEFAIVLPVLLLVLTGVLEVGRMIQVQQIISNASREAGRQASSGIYTTTQVQDFVQQYLKRAGLSDRAATNAQVTLTNLTSGKGPDAADQLDHFRISVSVAYDDITWSPLRLSTDPSTRLSASAEWYSTNDVPLEVSSSIPLS